MKANATLQRRYRMHTGDGRSGYSLAERFNGVSELNAEMIGSQ